MPVFTLLLKTHMEGVTDLQPDDFNTHQWSIKLKCSGCREVADKRRYIAAEDSVEIPNSRGTASYVEKCGFCGKQNTLTVLADSFRPYSKNDEFQEIAKFECRGTEPVEFQPTGEWKCRGTETDTPFSKIDLTETFADYDEKASEPVTIDEVEHKFA